MDVVPPENELLLVPGDSLALALDMSALGGIGESYNPVSGDMRPDLYLWWRVRTGPHAGFVNQAMADPDGLDGIHSPWAGAQQLDSEYWNTMQADRAAWQGEVIAGSYAFDFADSLFLPGDVIEYFFRALAVDGTISTLPAFAMATDPSIREFYSINCLPSQRREILLVADDPAVLPTWKIALRYNGYVADVYRTLDPRAGLNNGLAGRASWCNLSRYSLIIWDSGWIRAHTITAGPPDDKVSDADLLATWIGGGAGVDHDLSLWVLGNATARDLGNGHPFLRDVLGVFDVSNHEYDEHTGIGSPLVFATHPDLEYLGGTPVFSLMDRCRVDEFISNGSQYDAVVEGGPFVEVTHEWEDDGGDGLVAGILNHDPDGDGTVTWDSVHASRALYMPFGYPFVRDEGYGLPAEQEYSRLMVGYILGILFDCAPDWLPGDLPPTVPGVTRLARGYPNPFNPSTPLRFDLAEPGHVRLRIFDLAGRRVRTLVDETLPAGSHERIWDGRDDGGAQLASGVYFMAFRAGEEKLSQKLVLMK